jgi:hypothetical protein
MWRLIRRDMKWREGRKSMRRPSDQRKSCEEGVSTAASSVSRVLASIADRFSEAEGIIFNKLSLVIYIMYKLNSVGVGWAFYGA